MTSARVRIWVALLAVALVTSCMTTAECVKLCGENGVHFYDSAQRCECNAPPKGPR